MVLKLPWAQKWMFWEFEKDIFLFFLNYWVAKLKLFSGKARQSLQDHLNSKLVTGRFLENGFEANLISKTNVLSVWKGYFSVFCKFLSDEVETVFWESETEPWRSFKFKVGHRKLFRKWFWIYLELKNECSERWKRAFFSFLLIFDWLSWNHFLGEWGKTSKTV